MHFRFAEFLFIGDIFGQLYGSGITVKAAAAALRKLMVLDRKCGPRTGVEVVCSNHTKSWSGLRHKQDLSLFAVVLPRFLGGITSQGRY